MRSLERRIAVEEQANGAHANYLLLLLRFCSVYIITHIYTHCPPARLKHAYTYLGTDFEPDI